MSTAQSPKAMDIFEQLADLPPSHHPAKLEELCNGDAELRTMVEAMLAADARADEPFSHNFALWENGLSAESSAASSTTPLGKTIGSWRVIGELGRGGMGTVYAVQRDDGAYAQRAALKLIHSASDSAVTRERFLRERQLLAHLQHPNIATLLDGGFSDDGDPYFVMEHIDGEPIDQWCDGRELNLRGRVELLVQVLDAVGYAHRNLVVHRDLKPSNLLVDSTGRVKLLDFGIAKQLEAVEATRTMERALTFEYASPEQLHDGPITTATDIWQLGVVLHRLLSGAHPFGLDQATPLARQLQQLERAPEPLTRAALHTSAEQAARRGGLTPVALARFLRGNLTEIVRTCLRREPEARYPSVDAMAHDLKAWLDNRPITAVRLSRSERLRLWLRRNRVLAASAVAITLALAAGTGVALWQAREARRESASANAAMRLITRTLAATSPEQTLRSDVSVRQLLARAQAELDKSGTTDPKVRQPMQRMLGRLYYALDDSKRAAQLLSMGTKDVQPRDRAQALALADDLVIESIALDNLGRSPEVLAAADRAVELRRRFAPDDPEQQLRSLANITIAHVQKHGLPACRKQAEDALALAVRMQDPPIDVVLHVYSLIAGGARIADDRERLMQASDEGLAFADQHGVAPESPLRVELMRNRAEAFLLLGQYPQGERVARQAIAMTEKTGSSGSTRRGILHSILARALTAQGRHREALIAHHDAARFLPQADLGSRNRAVFLGNEAVLESAVGHYAQGLVLTYQAVAELDRSYTASGDDFRTPVELKHARMLLLNGRTADSKALLDALIPRVRANEGEDSENYALMLDVLVDSALHTGDTANGQRWLEEARVRFARRGLPPTHSQFARLLRYDAALARLHGELSRAEARQREAIDRLQTAGNPFDVAVAQAELARIRFDRGDTAEARKLLLPALQVMRTSVQPQQQDRAAAEALATLPAMRG